MADFLKIPVRYVNQFEIHERNPRVNYTQDVIDQHNSKSAAGRLEDYLVGKSILQHLPERVDVDFLPERDENGYFGDNIPVAPKRKIPTRRR